MGVIPNKWGKKSIYCIMYKLPPQPSSASDGVSPDTGNECHAAVGQFSIRNTFLLSCVQVYERGVLLVLRFLPFMYSVWLMLGLFQLYDSCVTAAMPT